jgi:hypothetical protein
MEVAHISNWYTENLRDRLTLLGIRGRNAEISDVQNHLTGASPSYPISICFRTEERNTNGEIIERQMLMWLTSDEVSKIRKAIENEED